MSSSHTKALKAARRKVTYAQTTASARVAGAEVEAREAQEAEADAHAEASEAREEALEESQAAVAARAEIDDAKYAAMLSARQAERAKKRAADLESRLDAQGVVPGNRSPEEWAQMTADARRKARQREMDYLTGLFESHEWRMEDVATVLAKGGSWHIFDARGNCVEDQGGCCSPAEGGA